MQVSFVIPGAPVPKGRSRSAMSAGRMLHFTPDDTVRYENLVRLMAVREMANAGMSGKPMTGPVGLVMRAYFAPPKSWSKAKTQAALDGEVMPTSRPDLDNVVKAVADGCNSVVWLDDSQVVDVAAHKRYSDRPRVEVVISAKGAV